MQYKHESLNVWHSAYPQLAEIKFTNNFIDIVHFMQILIYLF